MSMTTASPAPAKPAEPAAPLPFELTVERYDFGPLSRGTRIGQPMGYRIGDETDRRMQDVPAMPDLYVRDNGTVELDDRRMTREDFLTWARAVVAVVEGFSEVSA